MKKFIIILVIIMVESTSKNISGLYMSRVTGEGFSGDYDTKKQKVYNVLQRQSINLVK